MELNADTNGFTSRQSLNGWEAGISGNSNRWFTAEAEFALAMRRFLPFRLARKPILVSD
jgi:hypothetical protein